MRGAFAAVFMVVVAGCGSSNATNQATANAKATASTHINTGTGTSAPASPVPAATTVGSFTGPPRDGPAHVAGSYGTLLRTLCTAFRRRSATDVINELPHYQYNSGLRYGQMGDGEGQTGDPSLMVSWLAASKVRCVLYTPAAAGHGTLLASGWNQPGGWGLIEMDTFNGQWKINDFTFGTYSALYSGMHVAGQVYRYRG